MGIFRRLARRAALGVLFCAGGLSFASLAVLETNGWVVASARGRWDDDAMNLGRRDFAIVPGVRFRGGKPVSGLEQRLEMALGLFREGRVGSVLVSGDEEHAGNEATGMRDWLVARGVPNARIVVDRLGTRTLMTMARAAHVFGVRSAIICTQRLHAPRSIFLAEGSGIDAVAYVPPAFTAPVTSSNMHERWKTSLAFVERYLLGQTRTASPSNGPGLLGRLVIRAVLAFG
jgi:SanA protein